MTGVVDDMGTMIERLPSVERRYRALGMNALTALHDRILATLPVDAGIAYLDVPLTNNVGDLLIMEGTRTFFAKHRLRVRRARTLHNTPPRRQLNIPEGDTIVLQGGGNFGDIYPHIQEYRERIVREYPDHKIVILPQTIHYEDRDGLARAADRLNCHPDLTLFVRDGASLALARPLLGERVHLAPDMAHQLWPTLLSHTSASAALAPGDQGHLYFMRADRERGQTYEPFEAKRERFVDWPALIPFSLRLHNRLWREVAHLECRLGAFWDLERYHFSRVRAAIDAVATKLMPHSAWISSRLHGCLLGLLLDKPIAVVDNSYGKLSSYFATWGAWLAPVAEVRDNEEAAAIDRLFCAERPRDVDELWRHYEGLCARLAATVRDDARFHA